MYRVRKGQNETSLRFVIVKDASTNVVEHDLEVGPKPVNHADSVISKHGFVNLLSAAPEGYDRLLLNAITVNNYGSQFIYLSRRKLIEILNMLR